MTEPIFTTPGKYMSFPGMAVLHRILSRMVRDGDCWIWQGAKKDSGYGVIKIAGRTQHVHRVVYAAWYGEVPEGYDVHHTCHNILCVNPDHLSAISRSRNTAESNHERSKREHRSGRTARLCGMGNEDMEQAVCTNCGGSGHTHRSSSNNTVHRKTPTSRSKSNCGSRDEVPF